MLGQVTFMSQPRPITVVAGQPATLSVTVSPSENVFFSWRRNGEPVRLTPLEFRLLALLLANAGKVMTHRQLLVEVWGAEHAGDSHYLRIYIGHLRQKLEHDPSLPAHLLTEVGIGYRFVL